MNTSTTIALWTFVLYWSVSCPFVQGRIIQRDAENYIDSLELLHVVFRHGDRTPDKSAIYKNDPYVNVTYYPVGNGQLTNAGKRKEYNIGKELRSRYFSFLAEDKFTLDTVDARCTDYNRTKMSLQLVLASLFPPRGHSVWTEQNKLEWQPIPFNYWPVKEDHVLGDPLENCPRFRKLFWNYLNSHDGRKMYENHTELIKYLEFHTGTSMSSQDFANLYFTLATEQENGYNHPEWAKNVFSEIRDLGIKHYNVSTATAELKKYVVGFLVKKIVDDSFSKIKGEYHDGTKIFLYSAHEYNIAILLRFLDVFYSHVPPYGSYVVIELHNYDGVRGFKFYYQDYTGSKPKKLRIPGCGGHFCRLTTFERLFRFMFPESENECFNLDDLQ